MPRFAFCLRGDGHAERCGNAGRRMRHAERVVRAFIALRKTGKTAPLAKRVHAVAAASQNFVRIALMPHVPHDAIMRRVEAVVQRNREFHHAQIRRQVSARFRYRIKHKRAHFVAHADKRGLRLCAQLRRFVDVFEQRHLRSSFRH